jgi:hypothetical protein
MPAPKKEQTRKVSLPTMLRNASVEPSSLNEESRTVEIIWTTRKGSRVLRRRFFDEDFHEELGLEKKHVRMGRLESGTAPFLDQHGFSEKRGVQSAIGVVEGATLIEGKEGRATIRFSKRDDVEPIFQDIKDGILRNVSVGYNVFRFIELEETAPDGLKIFRAIDWEPVEISLVTAGADPHANIRSESNDKMTDCVVENKKEVDPVEEPVDETREASDNKIIEDPTKEPVENKTDLSDTRSTGEISMTDAEKKKLADEAREAEKKRILEIRSIVGKVGLDMELADEYVRDNKSLDEVRTLVIDKLADKDKEPETSTRSANISVGEDLSRKGRVQGMQDAILHRFRPQDLETAENGRKIVLPGYAMTDAGRDYAYLSLSDMARACLESQGIRTGMMPKHAIADAVLNNNRSVHSTSDFPEILANVANKTLRAGYAAAPRTFMPFTSETFVSDFKEISRTNLGDAPKLEKLQQGSEVTRGSMSEAAEKYFVEEYARVIALSRKTIINDDLGAFTKVPERMGRRASDLESDLVWEIYKINAPMADAVALFAAGHGNLSAVPAAPSEVGLNEARAAMRRQLGIDGAEISLTPAWIFVPPSHETATEKLIATTRPNNAADVNPFGPQGRTTLRMDVEPRLETGTGGSLTHWFVTADKGQVDMIEIARLEGTNGPQIQTRDGFNVNGMEIKIMHDVGAKAIDHRGLFKNAGA